ncbi:MAG: glucokinase, partial [Burkholderiales bacterium]
MNKKPAFPWLVADVGATNVRFAMVPDQNLDLTCERKLVCATFSDLMAAVRHYYADVGIPAVPKPKRAAIAIAASISGDRVIMTNHNWAFSIDKMRNDLQLERLIVLNDFTALAIALPYLERKDLGQVGGGDPVPDTPLALLGPGTGLGVSGLIPSPSGWVPLRSEGGHVSLSPANEREMEILSLVRRKFGHVSAERLISGIGLNNLYRAIAELNRVKPETLAPEQITERAINKTCRECADTLSVFCAMLGTAAANLAVTLGARGGVY